MHRCLELFYVCLYETRKGMIHAFWRILCLESLEFVHELFNCSKTLRLSIKPNKAVDSHSCTAGVRKAKP